MYQGTFRWLAAMLFVLALGACEREGPMETAGEKADEAVEETGERMGETTEQAGEAVEDTTDRNNP